MRKPVFLLIVALAFVSAQTRAAETHVITIEVARSIFDDYKALSDFAQDAPSEQAVPESVSLVGTAAMADIVAVAGSRADEHGWLALDTGQRVPLAAGDVVQIVPRVEGQPGTDGTTRRVVIVCGQGFATLAGRADVVVPSGF